MLFFFFFLGGGGGDRVGNFSKEAPFELTSSR